VLVVLKTDWHDRNELGKVISELIEKQCKTFELSRDMKFRIKLSQNIGYLIQTQMSVIASYEKRIQAHEPSLIAELVRDLNNKKRDITELENRLRHEPHNTANDPDNKHSAELEAYEKLTYDEQIAYQKKLQEDHKRNTDGKATRYNQIDDLV